MKGLVFLLSALLMLPTYLYAANIYSYVDTQGITYLSEKPFETAKPQTSIHKFEDAKNVTHFSTEPDFERQYSKRQASLDEKPNNFTRPQRTAYGSKNIPQTTKMNLFALD